MSTRNLDKLLDPQSVLLLGVDDPDEPIGAKIAQNLVGAGFKGRVMVVSENAAAVPQITGSDLCSSLADLPAVPDLAVIAAARRDLVADVAALADLGTKAVAILSAESMAARQDAAELQAMLSAARPRDLRIVGPGSSGVLVPAAGLNASFAHIQPRTGELAFITQSRAMVSTLLDWAAAHGVGFSKIISLGQTADVDFGDLLDYLALDFHTRAILLYVESIGQVRKFMSAARVAARTKPVLVIRGGSYRDPPVAQDGDSLRVSTDAVYDAAFARAGMLRVDDLTEMFDAAETMALAGNAFLMPGGDRLAILANGGGLSTMAADAVLREGGRLAELSPETRTALAALLPRGTPAANPVNLPSDADGVAYATALEALLADKTSDAIVVINTPGGLAATRDTGEAVADRLLAVPARRRRPVMVSWVGGGTAQRARREFSENGIPSFSTPGRAVRVCMGLERYRRNQALLVETPPALPRDFTPDRARAEQVVTAAMAEERTWLDQSDALSILEAYGIPFVESQVASSPAEAAQCAARLGGPVALKILAPDIARKRDIGGVVLHLSDPEQVELAARHMEARIAVERPDVTCAGFVVQCMRQRYGTREVMLGISSDPQFGPVLLFGDGGSAARTLHDVALALPPLNLSLARTLMSETQIFRLLQGDGLYPAADCEAIALSLIKLSQLVIDIPEIAEGEINPLLAGPNGVVALMARFRIERPARSGRGRLAIRPYPQELEESVTLHTGRPVRLRPLRPDDAPRMQQLFSTLDPEDIRLRFFAPLREMSDQMAARLTQLDYDREMALLLLAEDGEVPEELGIVRITADANNQRAEFAVIVRSNLKGQGVGRFLMERILAYARGRGIQEVWGEVLAENRAMLTLADYLGFTRHGSPDDPGIVHVIKRFDTAATVTAAS